MRIHSRFNPALLTPVLGIFFLTTLTFIGSANAARTYLESELLSATAVSGTRIDLAWTDPSKRKPNENEYEIQRSQSSTFTINTTLTTGSDVTSIDDTGLSEGTTYYYRVRAVGNKTSAWSNVKSTTTANTPPPADTTAPTVNIASPGNGTTYTSATSVTITATAADNEGVSKVEFYLGGSLQGTDTSSPYAHSWSTSSNGSYSWTARAYDAAGNVTTSSAVNLTVNVPAPDTTAPTVNITSPDNGATYTSATSVTITASADDSVGVSKVEFYLGGSLQGTDTSSPYAHSWSASSNGSYSWTARAYDAAGNVKTSSIVALTVDISTGGDTTPPSVSITSPASGGVYTTEKQWVTFFTSVSDDVGVTKVEFYENGKLKYTDSSPAFIYNWYIRDASYNGAYSIIARAYDAAGNFKDSAAVNVTVNIGGDPADTTAPTVSITSPANNATYTSASTVSINADAADNIGVSKVEFYRGSTLAGTDTTSPYIHSWSANTNGSYSWTAKAYDAAGNVTISSAVGLTVNIAVPDTVAPAISITSPANNTTYTSASTVSINADAADNIGVSKVEFYRGSTLAGTDTSSPYIHSWSANTNGSYSWTAKAYDAAGNVKTSSAVNLVVDIAPPVSGNGDHEWSWAFGGNLLSDNVLSGGIATDSAGDVVSTGNFEGSVEFGGSTITSAGNKDVFLAKHSAAGDHIWSKRFGDWTTDEGTDVAVDYNDDIIMTGHFQDTLDLGGGQLSSIGAIDTFLAKYAADGTHIWSKRLGGESSSDNVLAIATAVDSNGDILVGGYFYGKANFGGSTLTSSNTYSSDIFLVKFSSAGEHLWSRRYGGSSNVRLDSVAVASEFGDVAITGYFYGSADFGGSSFQSVGGKDIYIANYDSNGQHRWSKSFGSAANDHGTGLDLAADGSLIAAGYFDGSIDFGGGALVNTGGTDIFLVNYSTNGSHQWSKKFGSSASTSESAWSVAFDQNSNVLLTGSIIGAVNFGDGYTFSNGTYDVFVAKFSAVGDHAWSHRYASTGDSKGSSITADDDGNVLMSGYFGKSVDFGGGALNSPGGVDTFLVKYGP